MSHNMAGLPDQRRERAALMVAEATHTNDAIAQACGVSRRTVERWRHDPAFLDRVAAICDTFTAEIVASGIADRQHRVEILQQSVDRLSQVISERGNDPDMSTVPGGTTGIIVRRLKLLGAGESAQLVEEHEVDTATLRELRATLQQAAQELGQWTEKRESQVSGADGGPVTVKHESTFDFDAFRTIFTDALDGASRPPDPGVDPR